MNLDELVRALRSEIPGPAVRRGWNLSNLTQSNVDEPWGAVWEWSVDIIGPGYIDVDRRTFYGGKAAYTYRIGAGVIGTARSDTPEGLLSMVRAIVDELGLHALRDRSAARTADTDTAG